MEKNKTVAINTRATPIERAAIDAIANQEGRKMGEQVRALIRQEARARGLWSALVAQHAQGGQVATNAP